MLGDTGLEDGIFSFSAVAFTNAFANACFFSLGTEIASDFSSLAISAVFSNLASFSADIHAATFAAEIFPALLSITTNEGAVVANYNATRIQHLEQILLLELASLALFLLAVF